jgi:hypothetical protein
MHADLEFLVLVKSDQTRHFYRNRPPIESDRERHLVYVLINRFIYYILAKRNQIAYDYNLFIRFYKLFILFNNTFLLFIIVVVIQMK